MSKEDKQVIDMANSAGERREEAEQKMEAERNWERIMRKIHRRRFLQGLIPALVCILAALVLLVAILRGWVCVADVAWAAALATVLGIDGGMCLAEALRW